MKILSLSINNIKGINTKTIQLDLEANRPSILVAPNGFGKSSIACAFKSMNNNRIVLTDKNCYNFDTTLDPQIILEVEESGAQQNLEADRAKNEIANEFDCYVINSPIFAKASGRSFGAGITPTASLAIEAITLIDTVPSKVDFNYNITKQKELFGANNKILPNLNELMNNLDFSFKLSDNLDIIPLLIRQRDCQTPLNQIKNEINALNGTANDICNQIGLTLIERLDSIPALRRLAEIIMPFMGNNRTNSYLAAIQIITLVPAQTFKQALKYKQYLRDRENLDRLLGAFNSTNEEIKTKEIGKRNSPKKLVVEFPSADKVSNGQRDVLSFICQIQRAMRKMRHTRSILIIDEIFDYLDDGNLLTFQYYISTLIQVYKDGGKELYPILLTHLDPANFHKIVFKPTQLQIRYLARNPTLPSSNVLRLVKIRNDTSIKEIAAKNHFHYHPEEANIPDEFNALGFSRHWGNSSSFYNHINTEVQNYLSDQQLQFDCIAVMLALRIKIEQLAYDRLPTQELKNEFLTTHKTKNKLEFCEASGVSIPDTHYLLGIIYNDSLHWQPWKDLETPLISKLKNATIRQLILEVFS